MIIHGVAYILRFNMDCYNVSGSVTELLHDYAVLPYKVKTKYVEISNIADTSHKHPNSGQSTPMVKGCMGPHMFDM